MKTTHQDVLPAWCFNWLIPRKLQMEAQHIKRPPVPSGSNNPGQGSGQTSLRTGGAKNHWAQSGCQLYIATYNAKSIGSEDRLEEFQYELEKIKWDIVGISETSRKGEECVILKTGHMLLWKGNEQNIGGVGIIVHKRLASRVTAVKCISDRVIYTVVKINKNTTLKFIQVYAPTSQHQDDEVELLYEEISRGIAENKTTITIIGGDFNAKIGRENEENDTYIGKFGLGVRNERGNTLANFVENEKFYIMNTFYKKRAARKWTWVGPNGRTKNQIDFLLTNKKYIFQDVDVVNQFCTGSDHRMLRGKIQIDAKMERKKKFAKGAARTDAEQIRSESEKYKQLQNKALEEFNEPLENCINDENAKIITVMKDAASKIITNRKRKSEKFSTTTKQLLEKRRELIKNGERNTDKYTELNKIVRKNAKQDILEYNTRLVENIIEENKGPKVFRKRTTARREIIKLKDKYGNIVDNKEGLLRVAEDFYKDLYKTQLSKNSLQDQSNEQPSHILNVNSEDMPDIDIQEIQYALKQMKNNKAAGEDDIIPEMLKESTDELKQKLAKLFDKCLMEGSIPEEWENAIVILIYKKGDPEDLENYRPISLLSQVYKLFMRIITNRLEKKFEFYQPKEQAGFRKQFSTSEHLQTVRMVIEKTTEYNIPLWMAFIDFRKAFDTVEISALISAMKNARIDQRYINLIETIYSKATLKVRLHELTNKVDIQRGVRQGDIISPKLFTLVLEDVFKGLKWENKGINIQGERLNNLRFADDIALFAQDEEQLKEMIRELQRNARKVGLEMNMSKTKYMTNQQHNEESIKIDEQDIAKVETYIYLGQAVTTGKLNQEKEIDRRIKLTWTAYGKLKYMMNMKIPIRLKTKIYNECILPVTTYGSETWVLTRKTMRKLQVHQRSIERRLLGISMNDRKTNEWIRDRTQVEDIMRRICTLKWTWAGHVARHRENWSGMTTRWRPWGERRSTGRPQQRWYDDIKRTAGLNWYQVAQGRDRWKQLREAYIEKIENG